MRHLLMPEGACSLQPTHDLPKLLGVKRMQILNALKTQMSTEPQASLQAALDLMLSGSALHGQCRQPRRQPQPV